MSEEGKETDPPTPTPDGDEVEVDDLADSLPNQEEEEGAAEAEGEDTPVGKEDETPELAAPTALVDPPPGDEKESNEEAEHEQPPEQQEEGQEPVVAEAPVQPENVENVEHPAQAILETAVEKNIEDDIQPQVAADEQETDSLVEQQEISDAPAKEAAVEEVAEEKDDDEVSAVEQPPERDSEEQDTNESLEKPSTLPGEGAATEEELAEEKVKSEQLQQQREEEEPPSKEDEETPVVAEEDVGPEGKVLEASEQHQDEEPPGEEGNPEEKGTNDSLAEPTTLPTDENEQDVDDKEPVEASSKADQTVHKEEVEAIDSNKESDLEMRAKLLDRKEKELAEREEKLQKSMLQLEHDKKTVSEEKHKLSALFGQLVQVQHAIHGLIGNEEKGPIQPNTNEPPDASAAAVEECKKPVIPSPERPSFPPAYGGSSKDSLDIPVPPSGACYLVYEPDSSGRLVEYYSKLTPVENAIGRWVGVGSKKIAGFKFKSHGNVIIAGCSGGVHGRKNYFSGWCSFVRSACHMQSELIVWDPPPGKGLPVDVWVYTTDNRPGKQSIKLEPGGQSIQTEGVLGVAVLPKNTQFYDQAMTIDFEKWLGEGFNLGGSARI